MQRSNQVFARGIFTINKQNVMKNGLNARTALLTASMMLVGSASYMYFNQIDIRQFSTVAEAHEQNPSNQQRIHKKLDLNLHLSLDSKKQTLFVVYDSSNALQKEFMSEVEAK